MQERLQKIIAAAGIASRRKAEDLIRQGLVSVNGQTITELGAKADATHDHIRVSGKLVKESAKPLHILLNKPPGYVSTVSDPQGRNTVISLLRTRGITQRVYPVGRLDYASSGIILLTNDGALAHFLMAPASEVPRTYHAKLEGVVEVADLRKLEAGIALDGRRTAPCTIHKLGERPGGSKPWYEITLVEGRYHQVRRMFERVGQPVIKLKRVRIAFLDDRGLTQGQFRHLTATEVNRLKNWRPGAELAGGSSVPRRRAPLPHSRTGRE